ncbi:MAG: hypothetical protein WC340_13095 [Kiritimatiellia bacterium]
MGCGKWDVISVHRIAADILKATQYIRRYAVDDCATQYIRRYAVDD